jgi:predicted HTH domain antitoxin
MPTDKLMVHVYLSKKEKVNVEQAATLLGISVSSYIKVKLFQEGKF